MSKLKKYANETAAQAKKRIAKNKKKMAASKKTPKSGTRYT
jgi:hypothetical protein